MVFDKIKEVFSGGGKDDLGDLAGKVGLGDYSKYLEGVTFPIGKDDLLTILQDKGAQQELIEKVKGLAGDKFDGVDDIVKGLL